MAALIVKSGAKYQQYEEYKDSGVEWLGKIPSHWELSKLRYMFSFGRGLTITKADLLDTGVPCVNYGEVHSKYGFEVDPKKHYLKCVDEGYLQSSPYALLHKGDLVFADTSEDIEGSGNFTQLVSDDLTFAGYHTVIARPFDRQCSRFYAYLMDSKEVRTQIRHMVKGVKVFSITQAILKGVEIWLPSLDERETIANFLDHETAQIDTLIDKQQTLIQLLKEKRQAVISHAVTKGLNPDAPMKDSGVEWLGEVPEHWEITKFSHCAQIRNGLVDPKAPDFKNLVLYAPNHIEKGTGKIVYKETAEEQGADSSKYLCYKGEVIYSKIRPALAKVAICEEETALCSADMYPINAVNGLDNRFLYFFMLSDNFTKAAILDSDRVAMPKINRESLSDYRLPVPSVFEQMAICKFIANQNTNLEELESKAEQAIQLMQERRTALISAAVTGKIDVRGWQAAEQS